jgi:hypothetical protein
MEGFNGVRVKHRARNSSLPRTGASDIQVNTRHSRLRQALPAVFEERCTWRCFNGFILWRLPE